MPCGAPAARATDRRGGPCGGHRAQREAQLLIETRWAQEIAAPRDVVRVHAPAVAPTGDDVDRERDPAAVTARLPSLAWRTAREALGRGFPVLVQVPRRGYLPAVSCVECHSPARCGRCAGPLELRSCARRGRVPMVWSAGRRLRLPAVRRAAAARGHRRIGPYRRGTGPGLSRCAGAHVGARQRARDRRPGGGAGGGHARCRAGRRGRVRGGAAARHLGATEPGRPARRRGDAAPLDGGGHPGPAGRRRWPGRGGGRWRPDRGAGAVALGPGQLRGPGAGRASRAGLSAGGPDGEPHRCPGRGRRGARC